jgi:Tol biopolymer transport system component
MATRLRSEATASEKSVGLMRIRNVWVSIAAALAAIAGPAPLLAGSPSFSKEIKPFLARYCLECHSADMMKGGLSVESFASLMLGSDRGPVLAPGKPDESRLLLQVEGKMKPAMPPKKARQPRRDEIAALRAWIDGGAREDSAGAASLPAIAPRTWVEAPIASLAYRPDGKFLAAGGYKEAWLIDTTSSEVICRWAGQIGPATALAFSPDGHALAVGASVPGARGEVRVYPAPPTGSPVSGARFILSAHKDAIHCVAWSPDGKLLATCGYDRLIKLWDVASGKEVRTLRDHSDAVYGVAFHPSGTLLASAAADRTVKVWDVATGRRLYTLGQSTDWVYSVAWSPDGRFLAAGGVDKSIRVWKATMEGGKLVQSVYAHEGAITRLVYAADGRTLYSASEDRTVKAWDMARMVERKSYPRQPSAILALAVRPNHAQLAVGRYDGQLISLDESSGAVQFKLAPSKPKPPSLTQLEPAFGPRGRALRLTLRGKNLESATDLIVSGPGVAAKVVSDSRRSDLVQFDVTFPETSSAGAYQLAVRSPAGQSSQLKFTLDLYPAMAEVEPNDSVSMAQPVRLPVTVAGTIEKSGDVDFYRFEAKKGQAIGAQAVLADGSKWDPVLELRDARGALLMQSRMGTLGYTVEHSGSYCLGIHDRDFRGAKGMAYRLHVGDIPVVTSIFPLGGQRGTETTVHVEGTNLGDHSSIRVHVPGSARPGDRLPIAVETPHGRPLGAPQLIVGEFPEVFRDQKSSGGDPLAIPVPGTANGRIRRHGGIETWRFRAQKGQRLIVEVNAHRLGSPLDSFLEIQDRDGRPLPRALLRCQAKTHVTFRDHDSTGAGIRIEDWEDLAVNDYVLVGGELLRIRALPRTPDDDCQFFSNGNERIGYLDTTPTYHSMGTPLYKISIHPPGTSFPANGLPQVTLYYRNDDGGSGYGKDSRLFFDPPADGVYQVRIGDARGFGGQDFAYRLTIRPPRPSFQIHFSPENPAVWRGGAIPITVTADRIDGFDGPIGVRLEGLPGDMQAPAAEIPAEETNTTFALAASATSSKAEKTPAFRLVASARIDGQKTTQEVKGGRVEIREGGDILTTTDQSEVVLAPGSQAIVTARIQRRNGFGGRVPLEVRGLPHGVRVLDIGLNGILVTEKETSRSFVIFAEPWVKPTEHPFAVVAKDEAKQTEHAARSLWLRIK